MKKLIVSLLGTFSAFVTVIVVTLTDQFGILTDPMWYWSVNIAVVIWLLFSAWVTYQECFSGRPTRCRNAQSVNAEMCKIISGSGRTCIVSRNLSWSVGEAKDNLISKAKGQDLTLFIESENEVSSALKKHGADVKVYGGADEFAPSCRFTIANYQSASARLYIAHLDDNDDHLIYKLDKRNGPVFYLAQDLVAALARYAKT